MSYYHGLISSRRANSLLTQRPDGSFLIRDSQSQPGNFVLSAKYLGRMYHVLVFQQAGKYVLDSAGEMGEEGNVHFSSLDELVLFLTGHNLRVGEDEVQLSETCPCAQDSFKMSSNSVSRVSDGDDSDLMTDVFASLFGARCVVLCVAHSTASIDGQPEGDGRVYWAAVVKDLDQKGFYIRMVDKEERSLKREKKVGKQFQYDMPSDLLMTFLSEHGITCIGFKDSQEKDRFLHQIDRVVKLEQQRSIKLRGRADSEAAAKKKPTEITHRIKASEFNVEQLSPEWQYLFDQAGVTKEMLENKSSLQFILDTVYEIGTPQQLPAISSDDQAANVPSTEKAALEREQALALDENLKKASVRASMLSNLLQQQSLKQPTTPAPSEHICPYLAQCERFKDHLIIKHSMIALGPENGCCHCENCASGKSLIQSAGNPPQQFTLPMGWCQFMHSSQSHALAQHISGRWHVAYCCVPASRVSSIMRTGQLVHDPATGEVALSPDIQCACNIAAVPAHGFHDKECGGYYVVQTAFQVLLQPGTYSVQVAPSEAEKSEGGSDTGGGDRPQIQLEWRAKERTYIVHSVWIFMTK